MTFFRLGFIKSQIFQKINLTLTTRLASKNYVLMGKPDLYNCILIKSNEHSVITQESGEKILKKSLKKWFNENLQAIWFKVDVKDAWWISLLLKYGFELHHAQKSYIMLTKWLLKRQNSLPQYPFTMICAGGLVFNEKNEVLLVKEKRGSYLGWKIPGGVANYNEKIHETAIREVYEETGIKTNFVSILAFRQSELSPFENVSNIYFICVLEVQNKQDLILNSCSQEIGACKWMSRAEVDALPEEEFRWYSQRILKKYDEWVTSKRRGCYYKDLKKELVDYNKLNNLTDQKKLPSLNNVEFLKNNHIKDTAVNKQNLKTVGGFYFIE